MSEFPNSVGHKIATGLSLALLAGGCSTTEAREPIWATGEAHFGVTCPGGGQPGIIEVAGSGAMPVEPTSQKTAQAVVRIACLSEGDLKAPTVAADDHGGVCLGYKPGEYHLSVRSLQDGTRTKPTFFLVNEGTEITIGVLGDEKQPWADISKAEIHRHPDDEYNRQQAKSHGC